jgi:Protein of unknown function (DUF2934)
MEVSPTLSKPKVTVKRTVAKPKSPATAPASKPTIRKAKPTTKARPSDTELGGMIAAAAYHLAAERGFAPGHEVDDWLAAEKKVLAQFG